MLYPQMIDKACRVVIWKQKLFRRALIGPGGLSKKKRRQNKVLGK